MLHPDAKRALRSRLLAVRRARPAQERAAAAEAIAATLRERLGGTAVLAAHVPDAVEPGHGALPAALRGLGVRVLLPVVPDGGGELDWAVDTGELRPGRYGLLEPVGPRLGAAAVTEAEAVVVPALAVDRDGFRLGRGGGFYDRALLRTRPDAVVVALAFDDERLTEVPREPHDQPVAALVTPLGGWQAVPPAR